ncbi:meiotic recombination protein dmc1 [Diplodia corticola]|uniref:Meiotic recombination protein dmc1 n=1 Tax=Diplodia corticola TaxID=236234 RepID=A0A1J9QJB2_9PEZI|nr:meiotic recombination protein dmc1 [Diplodia corticola]OJD28950.1 meiotic recombination protein dmc1 [Diplodia corticola]
MATTNSASGGFFHPATPPASSIASATNSTTTTTTRLPHPRSKPLKAGGTMESAFIRFTDDRVRQIRRRYAKRGAADDSAEPSSGGGGGGDVKGYTSLKEALRDVDQLMDLVWVSGTPSLQIAYLLTLADLVNECMKGFPVSPKSLFHSLDKLDHAFASLIQGRDVETGDELPGFEGGRRVNATEKVRINSMVHYSRSAVVEAMLKCDPEMDDVEEEESALESGTDVDWDQADDYGAGDDGEETWGMKTAKVFDRTLVELGDDLTNAPPIGLRVEKPEEACRPRELELEDSDRVMDLDD